MSVWHKHNKSLFIHIPKTAGTAIERWIEKSGGQFLGSKIKHNDKHSDMFDQRNKDILNDEEVFCFSCVIHPYTLVVSAYFYINKWKQFKADPFTLEDWIFKDKMFEDTWNGVCKKLQHEYLDLDRLDYLIKFENIDHDFQRVMQHFGSLTPLYNHEQHISRTSTVTLTDDMKERVYNHYKRDFEIFDFSI